VSAQEGKVAKVSVMGVDTAALRFWLSCLLALAGELAVLLMIDAGPLLHYQHYRLPGRLAAEGHAWLLLVPAVQLIVVGLALRGRTSAVVSWLRHSFRPWQLVILALVFCAPAAAVSASPSFYAGELVFAALLQLLNLATLALAIVYLPAGLLARLQAGFARLLGGDGEHAVPSLDRFALIVAAWVTVVAAILSILSYQRHPHVTDEVAYLMHARFLANGTITLPAPPVPEAFGFYLMEVKEGQWYAVTPPGWPAALAVGVKLGAPWLINPLLNGINLLLAYLFIWDLAGRRKARFAALLLAASPWFIFMGMNFMTHTLTLFCFLAACVCVGLARRSVRTGVSLVWAAAAGVMIGAGTIVRPLDGVLAGLFVGLWAIGVGGKRLHLASIGVLAVAALLTGALVLPYNAALTGSPLTFPLNAYLDAHYGVGSNDFGFGPNRGFGWPLDPNPGHSPIDGLINANLNTFSLNTELLGWAAGSLGLAALAVLFGLRRRENALAFGMIGFVFTAFFFYYYSGGPDFGARYWYLMLIPLVILTVSGVDVLAQKLSGEPSELPVMQTRVLAGVTLACVIALLTYFPWRAIDKYYHFWNMRPDVREMAAAGMFDGGVVLVRGESHPDYTSAVVYNPLDLESADPIFAWDAGPEVRKRLLAAYPDRSVWIVDGPTITRRGYKLAGGPYRAADVPAEGGE
jgi:hypothetical protein